MPIDSERIQMAFLAAAACSDGNERAAIIADFAKGDAEFAARLNVLLQAHDKPGNLPRLRLDPAAEMLDGSAPRYHGLLIAGRYRLLSEIGEGGMGAVWLAEQIAPVRRHVALKLLKLGMDTRRVLARFEAERQALALMDHPFIAHVFDGGVTEFGRPFFVMEYVDGAPVSEFCDAARLTIRQRLRLFLEICQAVQHAHQKGVIHRDLKPSNVLVCRHEDRAVPKVIDFGLAKAMHEPLIDQTQQSGPAVLMGTPRYMSPEQVEWSNADIDTRADVYAMGAILYELLTGTTPIDDESFQDANWAEIVRRIQEGEPARPSNRLKESGELPALAEARSSTPLQTCREVRGDLDWITLKALEKDRSRRYQTVGELARDIERYLDHQPIEARPPSTLYRFIKFARRNRVMLSAGVLVSLTLIVGVVISTAMAIRARHAVKLAEAARGDEALHRRRAEQHGIEAELARAAEVEQRKIAQTERNEAEQRRARAELTLRNVRNAQEGYFAALLSNKALSTPDQSPLRKELLSLALGYYRKLIDQQSDDSALQAEYARAYVHIGELNGDIGLQEQAIEALQQAKQRYEELIHDEPQVREHCCDLAFVLTKLAHLQGKLGRLADAEASYRQELEIRQKLAESGEDSSFHQLELGRALSELANLQRVMERYADADESFRRTFEIFDAVGRETILADGHGRYLADALFSWANLQCVMGRYVDAARSSQQAGQLFEQLARDQSSGGPNYLAGVAKALHVLGNVQRLDGQLVSSRASYTSAFELYKTLSRQDPSNALFHRHRGSVEFYLGLLESMAGQSEEATRSFTAALNSFQNALELGFTSGGFTASRADALAMLARWPEAAQVLATAVEKNDSSFRIRSQLALLHWAAGNTEAHRTACRDFLAQSELPDAPAEMSAIAWACLVDSQSLADWSPLVDAARKAAAVAPSNPVYSTLAGVLYYRANHIDEAVQLLEQSLPLHDSAGAEAPAERDSMRASRLVGETALMLIRRERGPANVLARQADAVRLLARQLNSTGPCYCDESESWRVGFAVLFAERELGRLEQ